MRFVSFTGLIAGIFIMGRSMAFGVSLGDSLLANLEARLRFESDLTCKVRIIQEKTGQGAKTTEVEYFRRDSDNAFLIHLTSPESERGNGYLRMGGHLWMYRRNTRSFQHISRDESIGGSDAKADDFESRKLSECFAVSKGKDGKEAIREETLGKVAVYRIEVEAKLNDVDYPRKVVWIGRDNGLLLKEESYSGSTLMQTAYYFKYTRLNGSFIPVKQMYVDEFEKGSRTVVDLSKISTEKVNGAIFTKAHLESLSK